MKPTNLPKKVLLLGSGALKIGEAGEFDYSGSQAAKALREEGIQTVLVNPNIATIQTSKDMVDTVYFLPVTPYFVEEIIKKEKPDGILLGFGGQTALNCGMALGKSGVFEKYGVRVLGTSVDVIDKAEDRLKFRDHIINLGFKVPGSTTCESLEEVEALAGTVSFPVIVRAGFSLGGLGSGVARTKEDLLRISEKALTLAPQILVEEYLEHWKEIEYEIVRDRADNSIVVCNMENFDPMGVHTGESVVVAPSQTLTNQEYHLLREVAIKVAKSLPIVGECNIQYGLNPANGDYRIIELNPRLSRSSALASKATGYPLAYVAAKLALGYTLDQIQNKVTQATTAFFEPALDYVVVKIPRWDFLKFRDFEEKLGSEMQSVGEVMAIGRSFEEALQKAARSLDVGYDGILPVELAKEEIRSTDKQAVKFKKIHATPSRPYNIAYNIFWGQSIDEIHAETGIDIWFLERIQAIVHHYKAMLDDSVHAKMPSRELLVDAKKLGFSDTKIAATYDTNMDTIRELRKSLDITPKVCQIDTLAGEFPAKTNYLYLSYHRQQHDIPVSLRGDRSQADDEAIPSDQNDGVERKVAILGGGPYQIGSSVEFDWCAVTSVKTARQMGFKTIMINNNPETVSTDYDISDSLYFEELTSERVLDIADIEQCPFIVSVGGQIPNRLAEKLKGKIRILGSTVETIDMAEDREKFSAMLDSLDVEQPVWARLKTAQEAIEFADKISYPVLIRPSYVLSGRAMFVAYSEHVLADYMRQAADTITSEYPVVISKFRRGAKEVDFDAVAQHGEIICYAISEHVEHAGVHSGDATLVLPTFSLSEDAKQQIRDISKKIVKRMEINGPFNIQFLVNENEHGLAELLVIEANLRASRSFPFVSKVLNCNFIEVATKIMLGEIVEPIHMQKPPYFGVKVPHFSFTRLRQADPVLRVEMTSTGEVACFGKDMYEAYLKALLSTGIRMPNQAVLMSLGGDEGKGKLLLVAKTLNTLGFTIYATKSTHQFLLAHGIKAEFVYKVHEKGRPNVLDIIHRKQVDLVINISDRGDLGSKELSKEQSDGFLIRRATVDANIPLFTKSTIANLFISCLKRYTLEKLEVKSWNEYIK